MTHFPCAKGSPSGLSGLLLRVWMLADGQRELGEIAALASTTADQVRDAIDLLDHVGLLVRSAEAMAADLPSWALALPGLAAAATQRPR